jgi:hypothetical protein
MPRLKDLLEYLATPGLEETWVLLDIKLPLPTVTEALWGSKVDQVKRDEHTDDLFRLIAATLADVKTPRSWNQRVLIGCWAVSFCGFYTSKSNVVYDRRNTFLCA